MPVAEFATPGPLRDRLVQLIRSGAKTGTSSLLGDYEAEDQPLPRPGECQALIDSTGRVVATLEITEVATVRLAEVPWEHVLAEGEGTAVWPSGGRPTRSSGRPRRRRRAPRSRGTTWTTTRLWCWNDSGSSRTR